MTEYASDMICPMCLQDLNDHFDDEDDPDHGDSAYGDDSWVQSDDFNTDWDHADHQMIDNGWHEDWQAQYDDDPNPYHGTYSEE